MPGFCLNNITFFHPEKLFSPIILDQLDNDSAPFYLEGPLANTSSLMNSDMYTANSSNTYVNENQMLSLDDPSSSLSSSNQQHHQQNTNNGNGNNGKIIGNEFSNIKFA